MSNNVPAARCSMCRRLLDRPNDPTTKSFLGDCLRCLARIGDPSAMRRMCEIQEHADRLNDSQKSG
jgi:hypothetical protein